MYHGDEDETVHCKRSRFSCRGAGASGFLGTALCHPNRTGEVVFLAVHNATNHAGALVVLRRSLDITRDVTRGIGYFILFRSNVVSTNFHQQKTLVAAIAIVLAGVLASSAVQVSQGGPWLVFVRNVALGPLWWLVHSCILRSAAGFASRFARKRPEPALSLAPFLAITGVAYAPFLLLVLAIAWVPYWPVVVFCNVWMIAVLHRGLRQAFGFDAIAAWATAATSTVFLFTIQYSLFYVTSLVIRARFESYLSSLAPPLMNQVLEWLSPPCM